MKLWRSGETEWVTEQSDDHSLRRRRSTVCSTSDSSPSLSSSSESDQGLSLSLYTLSNSLSVYQVSSSNLSFFSSIVIVRFLKPACGGGNSSELL